MNETVDILMAVYNGEKYLSEQLESIFHQSYPHFRLTVRDNCSTDGTVSLLKKWEARFPNKMRIVEGEKNLGVIGNFSTLMDFADSPYVMLSDSDDVWLAQKVEKTLAAMLEMERKHGKGLPLLVHTDLIVTDAGLNVRYPSFWKVTKLDGSRPLSLKRALVENQVTGCTLMMNRELLQRARPIPPNAPMHDAWIALVAACFGKVFPLNEQTILYRQHGNNDSGATRYGMLAYLKKLFEPGKREKLFETRKKRVLQAELFLSRYQEEMDQKAQDEVLLFLKANRSPRLIRGYLLCKHGLLETGLLRKCFQLSLRGDA